MTPAEAGSKGGRATRDRHGSDFFRKIGSIGGSRSGGPRRHGRPLYERSPDRSPSGNGSESGRSSDRISEREDSNRG